jgi:methionine-rich copper-binding protein CopC
LIRALRSLAIGLIALLLTATLIPISQSSAFAYSTSSNYAAQDFATNFPNDGLYGPMGLAFDPSGNLFVYDWASRGLYEFGPSGGDASSALVGSNVSAFGLAFGQDGNLYASTNSASTSSSDVVQLDTATGAVVRTVASLRFCYGHGIATDPLSGDLFVACDPGIERVAVSNGTVSFYSAACSADGLNFGPDGTLYAACSTGNPVAIAGTNAANPGSVLRTFPTVDQLDGIGVGIPNGNSSSGFLLVNRNDGIITKVDASTDPATLADIFTGGSRGDFAVTGPDGCLYATQTDRIVKVTNSDGTCSLLPSVNHAPVVHIAIPAPDAVLAAGTANLSASFTDQDAADTHTCQVAWDNASTPAAGTVSESGGAGTCTSSTNLSAGVYNITVRVTDNHGAQGTDSVQVVVYDPNAGFVTGGGWINSPAGAYTADSSLTGKANFGFVSKYQKGATVPTGETEFQFQVGNLNFHSTAYQWLVVSGKMAQYKGTGTINGTVGYSFLLTARDGTPDGFRIKISNADGVVYDNLHSSDDSITSGNTQAIAGGSIVIHS